MPLQSVGGFQHHCVILWAVSTLITKAYIAAYCHGVVHWFVRHRWRVLDPRLSLSVVWFWQKLSATVARYCSSRVLMTFSLFLFILTCFAVSFALRSDATARLILDASVLQCTRASPRSSLLVAELNLSAGCGSVFSFLFACCRARPFC